MLHCGRKRLKGIFIDYSQKKGDPVPRSKWLVGLEENEMRPNMIEKRIGALWLSPFRKKS